jgi:eukaryotic-like serine/threonine-protein kinase
MSPEQSAGKVQLDARSDIYSVAAVAYFLLTGKPVFDRDSVIQVLLAHQSAPVPSLRSLRDDVPDDLQAVILRCLEKSPSQRFQDATSLALALQQCRCADLWTQADAARWWRDHGAGPDAAAHPPTQSNASTI